jgi:hypothetical protein
MEERQRSMIAEAIVTEAIAKKGLRPIAMAYKDLSI